MGLEAIMVCVDNSEYSRNADYNPSRFDSQSETANLLGGSKTGQNPETGVGLITMAGERVEVLLTPTTELGSFVAALANMQIRGKADVCRGIQTAQLALKHRQNKNQKQRIIVFVGSPIDATEKQLETLGKNLKKNNVSLDIVSMGEVEENRPKLEKLLSAVNSNDTSHYVEVPVGSRMLSDVVLTSPICFGESGAASAGGEAGAGEGFEFGVNPETDPELALALRISMEEERRRQEQGKEGGDGAEGAAPSTGAAAGAAAAPAATTAAPAAPSAALDIEGFDDMDEELKQALLLSVQEEQAPAADSAAASSSAAAAPAATTAATGEPAQKKPKMDETPAAEEANLFQDPDFVAGLLGSLPGVDINDVRIQEAIKGDKKGDKKDDKKDDKDKKDKK